MSTLVEKPNVAEQAATEPRTDYVLTVYGEHDREAVERALERTLHVFEFAAGAAVHVSSQRANADGETFYSVVAERDALRAAA